MTHMLIFKHISEQIWSDCFQIWAGLIPKDEALELYERSFEVRRAVTLTGVYSNPVYLESYILMATVWTLSTDTNYRVKPAATDPTHAVVTTKNA
jgi:hypothetical protein